MIKRSMVILPGILFLMSGAAIADMVRTRSRLFLIHNDSDFSNNSGSYEASVELFFCHACSGSTPASTLGPSSVYGISDLSRHLAYLLLPLGAVMGLMAWRRKK